ncbi:hypothetical protein KTT_58420 [Tengunoibacter tsumagoiensis]|uniref:Uncharacterized protein n=1 Tax=Tengunoibacter tsumagoiensis TaxID=2014871 RepID=A0A402A9Z4_9CHLR|nr:hypothetical protein KTT_58420 [Tengunoibacter tsumagoiensis]
MRKEEDYDHQSAINSRKRRCEKGVEPHTHGEGDYYQRPFGSSFRNVNGIFEYGLRISICYLESEQKAY